MTQELAVVGEYGPNEDGEVYGQVKDSHIVRYGKAAAGVQRYQCRDCGKSFTATKGTLIYRKQTPCQEIEETLALLVEGMRISSISRVKGVKEDTILSWLREAAEHTEPIEAIVLDRYQVSQAQVDGLWAYVGHTGQKGDIPTATTEANSGAAR